MPLGVLRVRGPPDEAKTSLKLPRCVSRVEKSLFRRVAAYRTVVMSAELAPDGTPLFYLNNQLYLNQTPDSIFQVPKDLAAGVLQ